jgi:serine/threonine protein kinase
MALTTGSRLGPYQITAAIGAGGMGEVYKATDTRLDRSVAIKVLPDHVAGDPELKQRFEREAKTLAALSHPHICPVFDESGQFEVYVRSFPASNDQKKCPLPVVRSPNGAGTDGSSFTFRPTAN